MKKTRRFVYYHLDTYQDRRTPNNCKCDECGKEIISYTEAFGIDFAHRFPSFVCKDCLTALYSELRFVLE